MSKNLPEVETIASPIGEDHATRVYRALAYMEQNLANRLEVSEIARIACYSPRHFLRVFRDQVGEGVREYIQRLRIHRAATLVRHLDCSITEIAFAVGFESVAGFNRAFSSAFGHSPTAYREVELEEEPAMPDGPAVQVKVSEKPSYTLAFVRHVGHEFGAVAAWARLVRWAKKRRLWSPDSVCIGISHDDYDTPAERRRYDACLVVEDRSCEADGVGFMILAGGLVAEHVFRGSLTALEQRWLILSRRWLPESGYSLRLPLGYDIYPAGLVEPLATATQLLTGGAIQAVLCLPVMRGIPFHSP